MTDAVSTPSHRIAFVVGTLTMGGSTTYLFNLAKGLLAAGHHCIVICDDNDHPMREDFEKAGISVTCIGRIGTIYEDRMARVVKHLRTFRPTAQVGVLGHFSFDSLHYAPPGVLRIAMALSDDPLVYNTIGLFSSTFDVLIGNAREIVRRLEERPSFRNARKLYVPSAVQMPSPVKRLWDPTQPLRLLFLGRVHREQKRVHFFPAIFKELCSAGISFTWTIAGDGPQLAELKTAMQHDPRVSFPGQIPYSRIPELFQKHDIFIMTSDYEGLPMSLVEAMANGMIPVVSDLPSGMQEVVDAACGVLVPPDEPSNYAAAIFALEKQRDLLPGLSSAAAAKVRSRYSAEAMAGCFISALPTTIPEITWPDTIAIKPPFVLRTARKFHPGFRPLRRIFARFKTA